MSVLLTILAIPPAIWAIDRWIFQGDFASLVRAEVVILLARRRRPSPTPAPRTARRGFGTR